MNGFYVKEEKLYTGEGILLINGCDNILQAFLNLGIGVVDKSFRANKVDLNKLEAFLSNYILKKGNCLHGEEN